MFPNRNLPPVRARGALPPGGGARSRGDFSGFHLVQAEGPKGKNPPRTKPAKKVAQKAPPAKGATVTSPGKSQPPPHDPATGLRPGGGRCGESARKGCPLPCRQEQKQSHFVFFARFELRISRQKSAPKPRALRAPRKWWCAFERGLFKLSPRPSRQRKEQKLVPNGEKEDRARKTRLYGSQKKLDKMFWSKGY